MFNVKQKGRENTMHNIILNILRLLIFGAMILTGMILGSGCQESNPEMFSQEPTTEPTTYAEPATDPTEATEATEPTEIETPTETTTPKKKPQIHTALLAEPASEPTQVRYQLTDEERAIVEAVVAAESRGEDFDGQALVALCILNTAEALGKRPDQVVLTPNQYAKPAYEYRQMVSDAVSAVFDHGYEVTTEPIRFFYSYKRKYSSWHENKLVFVLEHGGHRYFKLP